MDDSDQQGEVETNAGRRFGALAERYVSSVVHQSSTELKRLVELAQPQADWLALDVATGGGHTALAFAPYVGRVVLSDVSGQMLEAARGHLTLNEATNTAYVVNAGEALPFPDNTFDLVTCRVAIHHFGDAFRFMQESARILKHGGMLLVQDHVLPEHKPAAHYLETFEKLRDPSHNQAFSESEWRSLYLDAGLTVEHTETARHRANFLAWAERQNCSAYVIERLEILLKHAPAEVSAFIEPECIGTADATFNHVYIIIAGRKPSP